MSYSLVSFYMTFSIFLGTVKVLPIQDFLTYFESIIWSKPDITSLLETRVNRSKVDKIIA